MKMISSFTQPHLFLNLYEFISSTEHIDKLRIVIRTMEVNDNQSNLLLCSADERKL